MRKIFVSLLLVVMVILTACTTPNTPANTSTDNDITKTPDSVVVTSGDDTTISPDVTSSPDDVTTSPDETTTDDATTTPAPAGPVTAKNTDYTNGCKGTVPVIHDRVVEYISKHFKSGNIESAAIQNIYTENADGTESEVESAVTDYHVIGKRDDGDEIYFDICYDSERDILTSSLYENHLLEELAAKVTEALEIPSNCDSWCYFAYNDEIFYGLPEGVETIDGLMNFIDHAKHSLSYGCTTKISDFSANNPLVSEYEKTLVDFKLTSLSVDTVVDAVENVLWYRDIDRVCTVFLRLDEDSTAEKVNMMFTKINYASLDSNTAKVMIDYDFAKITALSKVAIADVPENEIVKEDGYIPYETALKFTVEKKKDATDGLGDEDIVIQDNDFGGKTTKYKSGVYYAYVYPNSEFDNLYYDEWNTMEQNYVPEGADPFTGCVAVFIDANDFNSENVCEKYVVFYTTPAA